MKVIQTKVYLYSELDDDAKERAREWWLRAAELDFEHVLADAVRMAEVLGLSVRVKDIQYSVSRCQGDGSGFSGTYTYEPTATTKIREEAPHDETLHLLADQLENLQGKRTETLSASIHCGRHMNISIATDDAAAEEDLQSIFADFAHWIYNQLSKELDYQTSEEYLAETFEANEYTFTEHGQRWG